MLAIITEELACMYFNTECLQTLIDLWINFAIQQPLPELDTELATRRNRRSAVPIKLGPIYKIRLCRMREVYDRPTADMNCFV